MPADRCPTCDREGCDGARLLAEHRRAMAGGDHDAANVTLTEWAALGCRPVDWRARALAAESRIAQVADELADELATAQAEIDRAVASPRGMGGALPSMSRLRHGATPTVRVWLGRLVERLRGDMNSDEVRAMESDAAKWRKVEPRIERLRVAADKDASDPIHVVDAAIELLAAAKEPS